MRDRGAPSFGGELFDRREALPSVGAVTGDTPATPEARYIPSAELGRGGMGCVRVVEDVHLHRELAWKEGDVGVLREAWLTAQLEHPGIVPVHDLGVTPDGQSFFAMRVVRGQTLDAFFDRLADDASGRRERVRLLLGAVQAVAWAHHRGVVHRDLKPANVLVGPFGEVQVIDWGLAALLEDAALPIGAEARAAVGSLELGSTAVGTQGFMAPEQADGAAPARTFDVYALGLLLELAMGPRAEPALRAIAARCLAEDPSARYPDAQGLALDLGAWLDGRPVSAHRYRLVERLERLMGRHKVALMTATLAALVLAAVLAVSALRVERERDVAVLARADAERALSATLALRAEAALADGSWHEAEPLAGESLALAENPRARAVLAAVAGAPSLRAEVLDPAASLRGCRDLAWAKSSVGERVMCSDGHEVTVRLRAPGWPVLMRTVREHERAALSPDGGAVWLLAGCELVTVVPVEGGAPPRTWPAAGICPHFGQLEVGERGALLWGVVQVGQLILEDTDIRLLETCIKPQTATLAAGDRVVVLCEDGGLWTGPLGKPLVHHTTLPLRRHEVEGSALAVLGELVFIGDTRGHIHRVALSGDEPPLKVRVTEGLVRTLALSPGGRHLAVAADLGGLFLLDAQTLGRTASLPARLGHRALWLSDGALLPWGLGASGSGSLSVHLAGGEPQAFEAFAGVTSLALSPSSLLVGHMTDATWVARAGGRNVGNDGDVGNVGDVANVANVGRGLARASGRGETVKAVVLDPEDRAYLATAAHFLARWPSRDASPELLPVASGSRRLVLAGRWLVLVPPRGPPHAAPIALASSAEAWRALPIEDLAGSQWRDLSAAPGLPIAFALSTRTLYQIDLAGEAPRVKALSPASGASALAAFPGGRRLALASGDRVHLRELGALEHVVELTSKHEQLAERDPPDLLSVAVDASGSWVAAGARDGRVYLWDIAEPSPRASLVAHKERVAALVFEGSELWSGGWDGVVRRFSLDGLRADRLELGRAARERWALLRGAR